MNRAEDIRVCGNGAFGLHEGSALVPWRCQPNRAIGALDNTHLPRSHKTPNCRDHVSPAEAHRPSKLLKREVGGRVRALIARRWFRVRRLAIVAIHLVVSNMNTIETEEYGWPQLSELMFLNVHAYLPCIASHVCPMLQTRFEKRCSFGGYRAH
jgi:hypothetical protein